MPLNFYGIVNLLIVHIVQGTSNFILGKAIRLQKLILKRQSRQMRLTPLRTLLVYCLQFLIAYNLISLISEVNTRLLHNRL